MLSIGEGAFLGCTALESISLGTKMKSIGTEAFCNCTAMTKLVSKATTPPACDSQALDDINKWSCKLYVPAESMETYKAAPQWKEFFFFETGVKDIKGSSEAKEVARYTVDGERISSPQKGVNIVKYSDGTTKKVIVE